MRILVLMRGSAGAGKSTFIKNNGLENYTLCADDIRMKICSPMLQPDGGLAISQKNDNKAWKILFELLEERMKLGEFTVIDATCSKTKDMNQYKELADKYRYRIYCIDMTDVPIEECKRRNANREGYKRVPEKAIDMMYARFATQKVPSGIKVIKPEELDSVLTYTPSDFSNYRRIHMVGDVHSSYSALKEYILSQSDKHKNMSALDKDEVVLAEFLNPEDLYLFVGDYIDRGIEPVETIKFLLDIYKLPNVILLEGNHEKSLRDYTSGETKLTKNFTETTLYPLNEAIQNGEINKKDLAQLCRKFGQLCCFTYKDKKVFACHGGISWLANPILIATEQLIRGVGNYEDYLTCAQTFDATTPDNVYMVSGHRNVTELPVHATEKCFNLEGKVEFGGHLRVVTLDENGFETYEIKNEVFAASKVKEEPKVLKGTSNDEIVAALCANKYVREKNMGYIHSFNFTRDAFYSKKWDEQTTKARGLFIDVRDNSVHCRGFSKFFSINEMPETKMESLQQNLVFPITSYVKENGFLGMMTYNKDLDRVVFATKSMLDYVGYEGDLVTWFKELWYKTTTEEQQQFTYDFLKQHDVTILCECVHKNDPHIIEYPDSRIYLLDVIDNTFEGKKLDYDILSSMASELGLICKEKAFVFKDWNEFYSWYQEVTQDDWKYNGRYIEGFVVEDSAGFMFKLKLAYYNLWKMLRGVTEKVMKDGYLRKTAMLNNAIANYYYGWIKEHKDECQGADIITLRNKFLEDKGAEYGL